MKYKTGRLNDGLAHGSSPTGRPEDRVGRGVSLRSAARVVGFQPDMRVRCSAHRLEPGATLSALLSSTASRRDLRCNLADIAVIFGQMAVPPTSTIGGVPAGARLKGDCSQLAVVPAVVADTRNIPPGLAPPSGHFPALQPGSWQRLSPQ
jgi:hypothetical protein